MIVYQADKKQFITDTNDRDIEDVILQSFKDVTGHGVGPSELKSWRESLGYMAKVLSDSEIPEDTGVSVEYHIPQTSKRIDMTLTGYGEDGAKNAVVVELKQWTSATSTTKDAVVVTFLGGANRETVHPSYQAWSYACLLRGFNEAVYSGGISIRPCAYLHNYVADAHIAAPQYSTYIDEAPVFTKGEDQRKLLRAFIKKHVRKGDKRVILDELEHGPIRPSKELADSLVGMMKQAPEFVLIDDQKTIYEAAMAAAQTATANKPRVLIVKGGPGTGKSVVAVNLLVALSAKRMNGQYVSKNAAPRKVYETKLTGSMTKTKFASMFVGSGKFVDGKNNGKDFLVVDEAQRLNEKSGLFSNEGENQIKEIINATKCAVFFIDEDQRVTVKDIGSIDVIKKFAEAKGAAVEILALESQFRCSGSDGYLAWLDNTLDIRGTANKSLDANGYDFRVFDDPEELHVAIEARNDTNRARVVAGYCWPWRSKANAAAWDIEIGDNYRRRWNLDQDGSLWIIAKTSINEVGCIHTCQGLEVDYIGVIVGPDLVVRNGKVKTVLSGRDKQDRSVWGLKSMQKADPHGAGDLVDLIIKNTYRTLMTRGMKGCFIYCTDQETRDYFRRKLVPFRTS